MQFRILGPVAVSDDDGAAIPLGSSRERLVLAHLLVGADRRVTSDSLIDALWEDPPATARQQLQNLVAGLRRRLSRGETPLVHTRPLGYELQLGDHSLDLLQFRHLVSTARHAEDDPASSIPLLRQAVGLWRGDPLSGTTPASTDGELGPAILALQEERVAAVDLLVDALHSTGSYAEVLSVTASHLADDPWNERLHEHRLRALAATGRRTEAGEAFRRLRRQFVDELGIEPGSALSDLNTKILEGAPMVAAVATRPVLPRELPPMAWTLVGRDEVLDGIVGRLRDPEPRRSGLPPRVELLVGVGGVGKTALALAAGHAVSEHYPDGVLFAALGDGHRGAADAHDVLGRFLRSLGVDDSSIPLDHEERVALYRSHTGATRVLVVLDNALSETQVRSLLPTSSGSATLITSRSKLAGLAVARRHVVESLDAESGRVLLENLSMRPFDQAETDLTDEIIGLCGHLPLALCVAGAKLASNSSLDLEELRDRLADQHTRLDELAIGDIDVRASLAMSVDDLPPAASVLLGRLGICQPGDWPGWVAPCVMDDDARTARRALDVLIDRHLIEPLGRDGAGQPRFRMHPLVTEFARAHLDTISGPAEIMALEDRVARRWLALCELAADQLEPGSSVASDPAAGRLDPGAVSAATSSPLEFFESEQTNLTSAVLAAVARDERELGASIALAYKGFLAIRGHDAERERIIRVALDDYPPSADQRLSFRLLSELFRTLAAQRRTRELSEVARRSLVAAERLRDSTLQRRAMSQLAWLSMMLGRYTESISWLGRMEESALASDDAAARVAAAGQRGVVLRNMGRAAEGDPLLAEMVQQSRRTGSRRDVGIWLTTRAEGLAELGRTVEARELVAEAMQTSQELRDDVGVATCWLVQGRVHLVDGDLVAARRGLSLARATLDPRSPSGEDLDCLRLEVDITVAEGRPGSASDLLVRLVAARRLGDNEVHLASDLARLAVVLRGVDVAESERADAESATILESLGLSHSALRLPAAYRA